MKAFSFQALVICLATVLGGCVSISKGTVHSFPVEEGKLIPKEKALDFVKANLEDSDDNGIMLFSIEGSSIEQYTVKFSYKGEKTRHYGYYGLTVEVREFKWPREKNKPFALMITGTAGPDTLPGRRIFWFDRLNEAKDMATALVALGAKAAKQ